ncbi:MAG: FKBP-type peptidyl-prolyl cis-trans isomerase [Candidatus Pacebacteria bacterium]|nr:FKBP-type peptidyl-prolyl cis-trans isomerase [Candidatus Paceibacterota bacterium]
MKKLSTNEYIAIVVGIAVMAGLVFFITFTSRQTNPFTMNNQNPNQYLAASSTVADQNATSSAATDNRTVQSGDTIAVQYTGMLQDGTVFDSSIPRGQPFIFTVGAGQVIKGWDEGLIGMKVGDKRHLVLTPDQAYGAQGVTSGGKVIIPPNATLIFDVQVVGIK